MRTRALGNQPERALSALGQAWSLAASIPTGLGTTSPAFWQPDLAGMGLQQRLPGCEVWTSSGASRRKGSLSTPVTSREVGCRQQGSFQIFQWLHEERKQVIQTFVVYFINPT